MGVRTPSFVLDEKDESIASDGQRFLWRSLLSQQKIVKKKAKKYKADVWGLLGGDMSDKDVMKRTTQIHTRNDDVILNMTVSTLEPVLDVVSRVFIAKGTKAHIGRLEDLLARDIVDAEIHPDTGKPIGHKWWIDVDGYSVLFQHHGKMGRLPWTRANSLNQKSARLRLQYRNPPDLFIQAHNHVHDTSSMRFKPFVVAAPCLKLPGDFEERIDVDSADFGGLYFVIKKGKLVEWDVMLSEPKGLTKWRSE